MKRSQLYNHLGVSLDLALEAHEIVRGETGAEIPGVRLDKEKYEHASISTVAILEPQAVPIMGKPIGDYITIEAPNLRDNDRDIHNQLSEILAHKLSELIKVDEKATVLVVGLGNWNTTPDALGPKVVNYTLVTRHLKDHAPEELEKGLRPVCALAPGVMGTTGIETAEIVRGVAERVKPDLVIAIDALAAGSVERIGTTIQLANTGINPGSGIGNHRAGINQETIGVPVIAIGVPTVVHAGVIAHEAMGQLLEQFKTNPTLYQIYKNINPQAMEGIINNVLGPFAGNLMVTPKEIDDLITNTARVISSALAQALHPAIDAEEANMYLH